MQLGVQGEAQCCVTGAAFQHMIQLGNESLLVLVMSNAVVFSRMKPYQKGQVMDLLGHRGLHKDREGQQQHLNVRLHAAAEAFLKECFECFGVILHEQLALMQQHCQGNPGLSGVYSQLFMSPCI